MYGRDKFITKDGKVLEGQIIHRYPAFEGGMRYIFKTDDGKEYRCILVDFKFKEYVA